MSARIAPAQPPFDPAIAEFLDKQMRGRPPLHLFATLARDPRLFQRFFGGALLDEGQLTLREREIAIDRTTALCGSEYEWGLHISIFGRAARLTEEQIHSTVHGSPDDPCWSPAERALLRACDALHRTCSLDDETWADLARHYGELAIIELLMVAGFYHTVAFLTNGLRLPLEEGMRRFAGR